MNIFTLSRRPDHAARDLYDTHLNSQLKEAGQMLCTLYAAQGHEVPYKPTHQNHTCNRWLRASEHNVSWLHAHAMGIMEERYRRKRRSTHATWDSCIAQLPIPTGDWQLASPPALAFGKDFPPIPGLILDPDSIPLVYNGVALDDETAWAAAVQAYRLYYIWKHQTKPHAFKYDVRKEPPVWHPLHSAALQDRLA